MSAPSFSTTTPGAWAPPPFRPHPLLRGGHAQTLAGVYLRWPYPTYQATRRPLPLDDGDTLILHDDCPPAWKTGDPAVVLVHGLAGCYGSGYMRRMAARFHERGWRSFRLDLRGCGAGAGLARYPYHAGRSEDLASAVDFVAGLCPEAPLATVGFSLGANIVLKYLGEQPSRVHPQVRCAVAACPPLDLAACVRRIRQGANRLYDRHFVRLLWRQVLARQQQEPDADLCEAAVMPGSLFDFDDSYTAPRAGFGDAANYYAMCSGWQFLPAISVPTLIVMSDDDPLVASTGLEAAFAAASPSCRVLRTAGGGHLGFVARSGVDPDRRWLDWRILAWLQANEPAFGRLVRF